MKNIITKIKTFIGNIIGFIIFGEYKYEKVIDIKTITIQEFSLFIKSKTYYEMGGFRIYDRASNHKNSTSKYVEDHYFTDGFVLEIFKGTNNFSCVVNLETEIENIKKLKLKKFGYNDSFFILTPLGFCPIFFGYRFSSIIFFLWAIFFTILRTYFFIKVQNDLNRAKLHLEYLYEIYLLENKQNNLE